MPIRFGTSLMQSSQMLTVTLLNPEFSMFLEDIDERSEEVICHNDANSGQSKQQGWRDQQPNPLVLFMTKFDASFG